MTENSKIAIIIPTYNRSAYLNRLLDYFSYCTVGYRIVIADSSLDEMKARNSKAVSSHGNLNILYLDEFPPNVNGWAKWLCAIDRSESKYAVICADDDFVVPKCIDEAVKFLDENADYVLTRGKYIAFEEMKSNDKKIKFSWRHIYPHMTIDSRDSAQRVLDHFGNYYPTLYAVHRTPILKRIFEQTMKYGTANEHMDELLCSMFSAVCGKFKSLDSFFSAKEIISNSCSKTLKDVDKLIEAGSYDEKYTLFKKGLALRLSEEARISEEEAGKIIDQGMNQYLKIHYTSRGSRIKNKLRRLQLPFGLNRKLKAVYANIKKSRQSQVLPDDFTGEEDFQKIRDAVLNSEK